MICAILTATGALPEKEGWGYAARTDVNADVLKKALWFRFPYPGNEAGFFKCFIYDFEIPIYFGYQQLIECNEHIFNLVHTSITWIVFSYLCRKIMRNMVSEKNHTFCFVTWNILKYLGQWGMPTVSVSAVFGMLAGVLASMIESVGDYYACAKLAGAPPPPIHAVNRGWWLNFTCIFLYKIYTCIYVDCNTSSTHDWSAYENHFWII